MTHSRFDEKKRVVVKIGSASLIHVHGQSGDFDYHKMECLVREISDLHNRGIDVCLVSSGAVAIGRGTIGAGAGSPGGASFVSAEQKNGEAREGITESVSMRQAFAAVGQARLMTTYQRMFAEYGQTAAQVLITKYTMLESESMQNAVNTFEELFRMRAVPIVNENDTVATHEIEFGDNDRLSAIVASLIGADLLILLSDIDGLYTDDPRKNPNATLVERVDRLSEIYDAMAKESTGSDMGTGGMATKMTAARIVTASGTDMIIANGSDVRILHDIFEGDFRGTYFKARKERDFCITEYLKNENIDQS